MVRRFVAVAMLAAVSSFVATCSALADSYAPAPLAPLASEAPARLRVDAPLPDQLAEGRVVIRYRAENVRILPVYGSAALDVSPRLGHLHVTVDDGPWRWVDASGEPLIINKLPAGPHRILIELADPTHKVIDGKTVNLVIPQQAASDH
jgi:Family of unknown function (DUF6130)